MIWILGGGGAAWLVVAAGAAVLIGRSIRLAEREQAQARAAQRRHVDEEAAA